MFPLPSHVTLRWAPRLLEDAASPPHPALCSHLYKQSLQPQSESRGDPDAVWHPSAAERSVHLGAEALKPMSSRLHFPPRSTGQQGGSHPQTPQCRHTHSPAWGCQRQSLPMWQHSRTRCNSLRLTAESVERRWKRACEQLQKNLFLQ